MTEDPITSPASIATRDALLAAIQAQIAAAPNATTLLRLAEAYAWTVAPDQPHASRDER
jgi:hypothetical protein